jgi:protein TonB
MTNDRMKRHFAIPAAIALAAESALLFGFKHAPVSPPAPLGEPSRFWEMPLPADMEPPPVSADSGNSSSRQASPAAPVQDERVRPPGPDALPMPPLPPSPAVRAPSTFIPPQVFPGAGDRSGHSSDALDADRLDRSPRALKQPAPAYPGSARTHGMDGRVVVDFDVDRTGRVTGVRVVSSTDPAFDEPTLRAVSRWRFEPGRFHGHIVPFRMRVPVVFSLRDD